jgi:hypothetical protein
MSLVLIPAQQQMIEFRRYDSRGKGVELLINYCTFDSQTLFRILNTRGYESDSLKMVQPSL